ncbi:MAG: hypothetical protein M3P22_01400 [bacterium]|nr:hypothetical protein [bacterium]
MKKVIHHLREQPEDVRRSILHITMIVCGIILIIVWIYTLKNNFTNVNTQSDIKESLEPLKDLQDNIIDVNNI